MSPELSAEANLNLTDCVSRVLAWVDELFLGATNAPNLGRFARLVHGVKNQDDARYVLDELVKYAAEAIRIYDARN